MFSKAKIKYVQSLHQKKFRERHQSFIIEGDKIVREVISEQRLQLESIFATEEWIDENQQKLAQYNGILTAIKSTELKKISALKTPNKVLVVAKMPTYTFPDFNALSSELYLVLENIQDPGNLGTIIRTADWFGIKHIFCSIGCVDLYNPKTLQATMGSFMRIKVHYTALEKLFESAPKLPRYGAILGGESVYETTLTKPSFLLIGNEGKGLKPDTQELLTNSVTIPRFGEAESLNASIATGILCALFMK
jgi:RNA methyltransferase, TrmH family